MDPSELEDLEKQLKDLLQTDHISPSKPLYSILILFQRKKYEFSHLCIDYWALNKVTIKKSIVSFSLSIYLIDLDMPSISPRLTTTFRIAKGDEPKIACVTRYSAYEWLVIMPLLTKKTCHLLHIDE